jgi:hypothetical protein
MAWSGNSFMGISLMAAILDKKEPELYNPLNLGVSLHLLQKEQDGERYFANVWVTGLKKEEENLLIYQLLKRRSTI